MTIAKIIINDLPVNQFLNAFVSFMASDVVQEAAGDFAVNRIKERTALGIDIDDKPFAQYSKSYGKKPPVNLFVTGEMLGSLEHFVVGSEVNITCESETAKYHEQGTDAMPQRQFIGLSNQDVVDMLETAFFAPLKQGVN